MERESAILRAWAELVCRLRLPVLGAWALLALVMALLAGQTPGLLNPTGYAVDQTPSRLTDDLVRKQFPGRRDIALEVVLHSDRSVTGDPAYQGELTAWAADLRRLTQSAPATTGVEGPLVSPDHHTAALLVASNQPADRYLDLAARARKIRHPGPAAVYLGGPGAVYQSLIQNSEQDLQAGERLSIPLAALLLLIVFGGVVASGLPVATALAAVLTALGLLGLAARGLTVSIFALNITTVIGLALGIDYSLLMVSRFREELRAGCEIPEAVAVTTATAGRATLVSGLTVLIGFAALLLSHVNIVWSIGLGGMLVVGAAVLASLSLIPALLATFGGHVDRMALPFAVGRGGGGAWAGLARLVMARPGLVLAGGTALALLAALPALHLNPAVGGIESLPSDDSARQAQSLAHSQLGLPDQPPLLVVAQGVPDRAASDRIEAQVKQVSGRPVRGPAEVPAAQQALYLHPPYAVFEVTPAGGANEQSTRDLVASLAAAPWPDGVSVSLTGQPAAYQDFRALLFGDLPGIALALFGLTVVVLGLAFRSLVLPLKAVAMNLLSVGVAYGVLVYVFQDGHGAALLRFTPSGFVDQSVVVVIFAALFGLSMDYEVFLLSRVREEFQRSGDTLEAVAAGLEKTGRIVTSAALVMAVVFASLVVGRLTLNKAFGVAFAAAILLDATLVRVFLVPAAMALLDRQNWWPGLVAAPSRQVRARVPPPQAIPAGARMSTQPLPAIEDGPLPDWIAPGHHQPVPPPWLTPAPRPASSGPPSWEVIPHPVKVPSRDRMPRVQTQPPPGEPPTGAPPPVPLPPAAMGGPPPADATGAASAATARTVVLATPPPAAAHCRACGSILPAPFMACPACGQQPDEAAARPLYITDTVTGLYNQRYLTPQLEYELVRVAREALPLGVLMFEAGSSAEAALLRLVELVTAELRDTDLRAVVSRKPHRLVVLLPNTDMAETGHVASRVLAAAGADTRSGLRVGMVWLHPGSAHEAEEVVAAALRSSQSGRPELM